MFTVIALEVVQPLLPPPSKPVSLPGHDGCSRKGEMPAKSQRQRAWAFANKGPKWARAHGFDNKGKLPKTAKKRGKKK